MKAHQRTATDRGRTSTRVVSGAVYDADLYLELAISLESTVSRVTSRWKQRQSCERQERDARNVGREG